MGTQATESVLKTASYSVMAHYYDNVYNDASAPNDAVFYGELAQGLPGPVLELGCGTGRVSLPLARMGHQVVGLDLSAAMLAVFNEKLAAESHDVRQRVELVQDNMAGFELVRKFGLIIVPFRAFQHLLHTAEQRSCLECVARHLAPEGRFVLDLFDPDIESIARNRQTGPVWVLNHESVQAADGSTLRRYHMVKTIPALQLNQLWFRYEEYNTAGELVRTGVERADMRWLYREEARWLLELCGLEVEALYGGYDKTPPDTRYRELIYVCRHAAHGSN